MAKYFLALVFAVCCVPFAGCNGSESTVVAPPEEDETVVPVEGMSDEEYAKEMQKSME